MISKCHENWDEDVVDKPRNINFFGLFVSQKETLLIDMNVQFGCNAHRLLRTDFYESFVGWTQCIYHHTIGTFSHVLLKDTVALSWRRIWSRQRSAEPGSCGRSDSVYN